MTARAVHHCPNCRAPLIAARISRFVNERWVSSLWCCEACGHEHETSTVFPQNGKASSETTSDF